MDQIDKEFKETRLLMEETRKAQRKVFIQFRLLAIALGMPIVILIWTCIWAMDHRPEVFQKPVLFMISVGIASIFVTWFLFFIIGRLFKRKKGTDPN